MSAVTQVDRQNEARRQRQHAARFHLVRRRAHIVRIERILRAHPAPSLAELPEEALDELWAAAISFGDGPLIMRLCLEFRRRAEALR